MTNPTMTMECEVNMMKNGYLIQMADGNEAMLVLTWGLSTAGGEPNRDAGPGGVAGSVSGTRKFEFHFCWHLTVYDVNEQTEYSEAVNLPVEKYRDADSFRGLLSGALNRILTRWGRGDSDFAAFLIRKYGLFFRHLVGKLDDIKRNIDIVTDIFEQPLTIPISLIGVLGEARLTYPEKKEPAEPAGSENEGKVEP